MITSPSGRPAAGVSPRPPPWRDAREDLRRHHGIDTRRREWWAGEGSAAVECFGEVGAVAPALDGLDLADSVVAVARTA